MASIFISYSRKNLDAALRLETALIERGHDIWRYVSGLPEASLWRDEIATAIERSDVFLFLVSKESLRSGECRKEFEHARNLHKRIVPVVVDGVEPSEAPPDLSDINWIDLSDAQALERID